MTPVMNDFASTFNIYYSYKVHAQSKLKWSKMRGGGLAF